MAKRKSKAVVEEIEEVEDEEIEDIEDLEDLADEEPEDDTEDEEEDEDEAPKKTRAKKGKAKAKKPAKEGIGTADLAEALGTDGRNLRVMLRKKGANKTKRFKEQGRYHWESIEEALEELGFDDVEEAQDALKEARDERLEELKSRPKAKAKSKSSAKTKKRRVVEEDDDEDEDDEDED